MLLMLLWAVVPFCGCWPVWPGGPQCTWFLSPNPQPGLHAAGVVVVDVGGTVVVVDAVVDVVVVGCVVVVVDAVVVVVGAVVVVVDAVVLVVDDDVVDDEVVDDDVLDDEVLDDELVDDVPWSTGEKSAPSVNVVCPGVVGKPSVELMIDSSPLQPTCPVAIAGMMNVLSASVESPVAVLYGTPPAVDVLRLTDIGPSGQASNRPGIASDVVSCPLNVT
jgi:hypothetical protein